MALTRCSERRGAHGLCPRNELDVQPLANIEGVMIANIVTNPSEAASTGQPKLRTKLSYDDGGLWTDLTIDVTETNQPCKTNSGCALHLHSLTSYAGRANHRINAPNAVGLAVANGNTGDALLPYARASTFLTTDAGATWRLVRAGPHHHAFGDSGALLVIANDLDPTDHVRYSWDYGQSWQYYTFITGDKVRVWSLTTSLDASSERFLLLGETVSGGKAVAIGLDFANLHMRTCGAADYEWWTPSTSTGSKCVLGREIAYQRRKPDAVCAVKAKFQDPDMKSEACPCYADDFECDYDFVPNTASGDRCVPAEGKEDLWDPPEVCAPGTTYYLPSGFRKIPIDHCVGGADLTKPVAHTCPGATVAPTKPTDGGGGQGTPAPGTSTGGTSTATTVAVVLAVVAAVVLVGAGVALWWRRSQGGDGGGGGGSSSSWGRAWRNIKYKAVRQEDIESEEFLVDDY